LEKPKSFSPLKLCNAPVYLYNSRTTFFLFFFSPLPQTTGRGPFPFFFLGMTGVSFRFYCYPEVYSFFLCYYAFGIEFLYSVPPFSPFSSSTTMRYLEIPSRESWNMKTLFRERSFRDHTFFFLGYCAPPVFDNKRKSCLLSFLSSFLPFLFPPDHMLLEICSGNGWRICNVLDMIALTPSPLFPPFSLSQYNSVVEGPILDDPF